MNLIDKINAEQAKAIEEKKFPEFHTGDVVRALEARSCVGIRVEVRDKDYPRRGGAARRRYLRDHIREDPFAAGSLGAEFVEPCGEPGLGGTPAYPFRGAERPRRPCMARREALHQTLGRGVCVRGVGSGEGHPPSRRGHRRHQHQGKENVSGHKTALASFKQSAARLGGAPAFTRCGRRDYFFTSLRTALWLQNVRSVYILLRRVGVCFTTTIFLIDGEANGKSFSTRTP